MGNNISWLSGLCLYSVIGRNNVFQEYCTFYHSVGVETRSRIMNDVRIFVKGNIFSFLKQNPLESFWPAGRQMFTGEMFTRLA